MSKKEIGTHIVLKNVDVKKLTHALEPALLIDKRITMNIDIDKGLLYGFSGGGDKWKFWSTQLSDFCEQVTQSADYESGMVVKAVIMDSKGLTDVMGKVGDKIDIQFNVRKHPLVYESSHLTLIKDRLTINFACGSLSIGQVDISDEEKEIKLGVYGDTHEFTLFSEELQRIKQLSNIQTLEAKVESISISSKDGKLRIWNDVFDNVFENIEVGDIPEYKFKTSVFAFIDNDNYDVKITRTPKGIKKIMFFSQDRDIQFIAGLLVPVSEFADEKDIANEFLNFKG